MFFLPLVRALRLPRIRRRALLTLAVLALLRLGQHLPLPGVDVHAVRERDLFTGPVKLLSGNALPSLSVLGLSVFPYVAAWALLDLAVLTVPRLNALAAEGAAGAARLRQYRRILTVPVAAVLAWAVVAAAARLPVAEGHDVLHDRGLLLRVVMVVCLTAGAVLSMYLAELVTNHGFGEGVSVLLAGQIMAVLPGEFGAVLEHRGVLAFALLLALVPVTVFAKTLLVHAQRRVPVQYAKRMIGRRPFGGTPTYVPVRLGSEARPVVFAVSLLFTLALLSSLVPHGGWLATLRTQLLDEGGSWYLVFLALLVIFSALCYAAIAFNPQEVADQLWRHGGFVPGIRAGRPTAEYLHYVHARLAWAWSVGVCVLALTVVGMSRLLGGESAFPYGGEAIFVVTSLVGAVLLEIETERTLHAYGT
ncbi:preprotein translocase subunit SecY [Kitasatospora kifunensis]|uniref:Preprotein translocase subunit SecY n=1 Tax=Kitasatospora kifunensis TaxID=58351 RepID=A0A7W7R8V4_KITKI|nr:hypothetical protein [Kitasatospora kifunensis]MBB4927516.1 preprotein translocase subunit SecY [Kitasatospora kifunensis]